MNYEKERKKERMRVLNRIRPPHLRLDATSPCHYTTKWYYVSVVKRLWKFRRQTPFKADRAVLNANL